MKIENGFSKLVKKGWDHPGRENVGYWLIAIGLAGLYISDGFSTFFDFIMLPA